MVPLYKASRFVTKAFLAENCMNIINYWNAFFFLYLLNMALQYEKLSCLARCSKSVLGKFCVIQIEQNPLVGITKLKTSFTSNIYFILSSEETLISFSSADVLYKYALVYGFCDFIAGRKKCF